MVSDSDKMFVYGTLRSGFPLHHHLHKEGIRFIGQGKIRGLLFDLGQYPGAVRSNSPTDEIFGEVYQLSKPLKQLATLDDLEEFDPENPDNSLYLREIAKVRMASGETLDAWAYFLRRKPADARPVFTGDYARNPS